MGKRIAIAVLLGVSLLAMIALVLHGPIPQPAAYSSFADQRTILRVPNFWNVVSNLSFVLVGAWGLIVLGRGRPPGLLPPLRHAWLALFAATLAIGVGSALYHLAPSDSTLALDRLPMTVAFMAMLAIIIGEQVDVAWGARLLVPLLLLGVGSVAYWRLTAVHGTGDLRPYVLVQYLPMLLIPLALLLFRPSLQPVALIWAGCAAYAVAKALDLLDAEVRRLLGGFGGHAIKHVLAALAVGIFVEALRRREPRANGENR